MTHVIVAAPPSPGELTPLLAIGQALEADGHEVSVLVAESLRDVVEPSGLTHVPITGAGDVDMRRLTELFPDLLSIPPGPPQLVAQWIHAFVNPMPAQHDALQELLRRHPDSVLIANSLFTGAWPVVLGADGPRPRRWVGVGTNPVLLPSDDTTWFGPRPEGEASSRAEANRRWNEGFASTLRGVDDRVAEVTSSLGATTAAPSFIESLFTLPDAFAALTVDGFEFHRSDAPNNFHLVGILPPASGDGWLRPEWWADLDDDRPVVVVTQGTYANFDLTELVAPAIEALSTEPVLVVAALGREIEALDGPLPKNVRVASFVPFGPLFEKADLFLTNGGMGATQQAIAAGVPVVVAGMTEDKPAVAARVAAHGLGLDLGTSRPSREQIVRASRQVFHDGAFRRRVRDLVGVYASHDAIDEIARLAGLRA